MRLKEITDRINQIRQTAGDDEVAHGKEDALYRDFVKYVASLDYLEALSRKAKTILETEKIDFARWRA